MNKNLILTLMAFHFLTLQGQTQATDAAPGAAKTDEPAKAAETVLPTVEVTTSADLDYDGSPRSGVVKESAGTALFGEADRKSIPFSVNIIGSAEIKDRQVSTFSQALATDPSVGNSYFGAIPYDTVSVRGFPISNFIYDGQLYWDAYTSRGVESTEKIELLRGPAAFRYGFVAPGGVMNIVSKKPTENPFASILTSVSEKGRGTVHLDIGRRFGDEKKFGLRLNAAAADGPLWMDDATRERQLLALAADYRVTADLTVTVNLERDSTESRGGGQEGYPDVGLDPNFELPDPVNQRKQWQPEWGYSKIREDMAAARVNWRINPQWTLDLTARTGEKSIESWGGVTYMTQWQTDGSHTLSPSGYKNDPIRNNSYLAFLQGRVETGSLSHQLTTGYSHTRFTNDLHFASNNSAPSVPSNIYEPNELPNPGPGTWDKASHEETVQEGYFISDMMTIGAWHPLIGVRSSTYESKTAYTNGQLKNSKTTPLYGLSYDVSKAVTLYASHALGLERGPRAPINSANALEQMPALETESTEIGFKADVLNDQAIVDVALFDLEKTAAYEDPTTKVYALRGKQKHRGLEVIAKGRVWEPLEISTGFTYIDGKLRGDPATSGSRPENVPTLKAVFAPEYRVHGFQNFYLLSLATYTGKRDYNTPNNNESEAFTLLDLGARHELALGEGLFITRLNVENVADLRYWANVTSWGGGRGVPRTGRLSFEWQF